VGLSRLDEIRAKSEAGKRLDREDGRWLLTEAPLVEVGALAQEARFRANPARRVTFVIPTTRTSVSPTASSALSTASPVIRKRGR
jgi:2-iminoacetate synthase ThiH